VFYFTVFQGDTYRGLQGGGVTRVQRDAAQEGDAARLRR
jgi:hypothetical protein